MLEMYLERNRWVARKVYWVASHRKAFLAPSRYASGVCMLHVAEYAKWLPFLRFENVSMHLIKFQTVKEFNNCEILL